MKKTQAEKLATADLVTELRSMSQQMVALQRRLFELNLIKASHAVNAAVNAMGWEVAEILEKFHKENE